MKIFLACQIEFIANYVFESNTCDYRVINSALSGNKKYVREPETSFYVNKISMLNR